MLGSPFCCLTDASARNDPQHTVFGAVSICLLNVRQHFLASLGQPHTHQQDKVYVLCYRCIQLCITHVQLNLTI